MFLGILGILSCGEDHGEIRDPLVFHLSHNSGGDLGFFLVLHLFPLNAKILDNIPEIPCISWCWFLLGLIVVEKCWISQNSWLILGNFPSWEAEEFGLGKIHWDVFFSSP